MVLFLDTPGSRRISRQDLMRIPLPEETRTFGGFNLWSALQCFTETKKPSFQKGGSRALSAANSTRVINDILLEEGCIG